jgi:hypothetical protein
VLPFRYVGLARPDRTSLTAYSCGVRRFRGLGPAPAGRPGVPRRPSGTRWNAVPRDDLSEGVRDALLGHLAEHGIFAPEHWQQNRDGSWSGDEDAVDLDAQT